MMAAEAASSTPPLIDASADADAISRPSDLQGYIDAIEQGRAYGWAFDRAHPDARLRIELRLNDRLIGETIANRARPDLAAGGVGDGACAFEAAIEGEHGDGDVLTVVAVNPATGARHILPGPAVSAAPAPPANVDIARVEPLLELLQSAQRRALAAMQSAERKFDDAAARLNRIPDLARLHELGQSLDHIRATQGDLARRIAEAEVFLVRIDGLLTALESEKKRAGPEASFNRHSLVVIGLGLLTIVSTGAAILLAVFRH